MQEKENMATFIAKKCEMGLTRMSLSTKRHEIRKLEEEVMPTLCCKPAAPGSAWGWSCVPWGTCTAVDHSKGRFVDTQSTDDCRHPGPSPTTI